MKRFLAVILAIAMMSSLMVAGVANAENEDAIFTLASVSARPGDTIDVAVTLKSSVAVNSIALSGITYDENALEFVEFADYEHLDSKTVIPIANFVDNANKTIMAPLKTAEAYDGAFCTIKFKVKENADGEIAVSATSVIKNGSDEKTSAVVPATIKVLKETMKGLSFKGAEFTYDGTAKSIAVAGAPQGAKVSYAIENETVVYDSISKVEAGTYNVTATVSAPGYNTETLKAVLKINPKPVTVEGLKAEDKTYDGTRDAWVDNTAATISGKVGDDDVHVGLPQEGEFASANAGNNIEVIIEELKLAGEDAHNYTLAAQPKLYANIAKVPLTVTAIGDSKKKGTNDPEFKYDVNGETIAPDTLKVTLKRAAGEDVGKYDIIAEKIEIVGGNINNYDVTFNKGVFEILDKTPQTITVAPVEAKTYGDADFEIEVTEDSAPQLGEFTYEVSEEDQKVVTVSENGTVTIVGAGKATVTVKRNGNDDFATLEVPVEIDVKPYKITAILDEATKKPVLSGVFESDLADVAIDFDSAKTTVVSHEPISESAIKTTSNVEVRKLKGTKAANYKIDPTVVNGVIDEITVMEEELTEDENVTIEAAQVDDKTVIVTDVTVAPEAEVETVTIDVTAIENSKVNTVAIPKATVDTIDAALEITLKDGSAENKDATISLDADALASVQTAAGEKNATTISISVDKQEKEELETEQAAKVEEFAAKTPVVFSLSITDENDVPLVANFGTGNATVKLPYEKPAINGNVIVKYLDNNGELADVVKAVYDAVNKFVSITLDHFSEYLIYTEPTVVNNNNGYTGGGNGGLQAGGDKSNAGADKLGNEDKTETPEQTPVVTPSTPAGFADLGNHAWAADAIANLVNKGIIKGTSATTYSPAKNIIRADFVALVVRMFNLSSADTANFADVNASDYFAAELAIAKNNGIVGGIGDNKFAPRGNITRQDMMVMLYRAMQKLGIELNGTQTTDVSDMDTVSEYAKEAVEKLMANGIINGKNGKIDPKANATRAEVAVMLNRVLDLVK